MASLSITGISFFHEVPGLVVYMVLENPSTLHGYPLQYFTTFSFGPNALNLPYFLIDVFFWFIIVFAALIALRGVKLRGSGRKQST